MKLTSFEEPNMKMKLGEGDDKKTCVQKNPEYRYIKAYNRLCLCTSHTTNIHNCHKVWDFFQSQVINKGSKTQTGWLSLSYTICPKHVNHHETNLMPTLISCCMRRKRNISRRLVTLPRYSPVPLHTLQWLAQPATRDETCLNMSCCSYSFSYIGSKRDCLKPKTTRSLQDQKASYDGTRRVNTFQINVGFSTVIQTKSGVHWSKGVLQSIG